jgi:translation initiation factor IF-2
MLITKFVVPRVKSAFKEKLQELQEQFIEEADNSGYGGGGYGGGGGGGDMFAKFDPGAGYGGGAFKKKPEQQRKGSEGARPKSQDDGGRGRGKNFADEQDDDAYFDDEGGGEDYFGDDGVSVSLADIPAYVIRNMVSDGLSMEDVQISLYGEYGAKVSVAAIRRKMREGAVMGRRKGNKRTGKTRKDRAKRRNARYSEEEKGVPLKEPTIMIKDLAVLLDISAGQVVGHLMMNMGIMATMNQNIDREAAAEVVVAFGKFVEGDDDDDDNDNDDDDDYFEDGGGDEEFLFTPDGEQLTVERLPRAPVVTIMGHVDHGKTSLLDAIRKTSVASGEAGGITQGISAFKVNIPGTGGEVCFIDTPGHAAFSEMRTRGATVTDIVVLVVAADDGIMEQTKECIVAAKRANCPIVVAVNKIDKEGADVKRITTELMEYDVLLEEYGGTTQMAEVSAKANTGIDTLLEKVLIQAELMNLRAPKDIPAVGTVIEARVDRGMGVMCTALVSKGTLKIGDYMLCGPAWGRVRRLINDQGENLLEAGPSTPVQVMGLNCIPAAGNQLSCGPNEASVRDVAESRTRLARQGAGAAVRGEIISAAAGILDGSLDQREVMKVPVIVKGDVSGSIEAIKSSLMDLTVSDDEAICMADVVYCGVGDVTSSDVAISAASRAKILAFNVAAGMSAMNEARAQNVEIGYYNVVYDLLDEMKFTITSTLSPPPPGVLVGRASVKKVFRLGRVGKVAGCQVTEGSIRMDGSTSVRVMRGRRNPVFTGKLKDLKIVKDSVSEVSMGSECGMSFEDDFHDFEEGDIVECFSSRSPGDDDY